MTVDKRAINRESGGVCDLCGLPLRRGTVAHQTSSHIYRFCCHGCHQVFLILSQSPEAGTVSDFKSTELFRQCQAMGLVPKTASEVPDVPPENPPVPEHALTLHLAIDGMWCPSCAWLVDKVVGQANGVYQSNCMFSTDSLRCRYDPVRTSPHEIIESIRKVGYRAKVFGDDTEKAESRSELIRFGVSLLLTMNVMMLSFALYSGFWGVLSEQSIRALSIPILLMAMVVFFYGGRHIHARAWQALRTGAYGMETLISFGSGAAFGYSLWGFLTGSLHLYFDTAAMLITLVLIGKMLETGAKRKIQTDLSHFLNLWPRKVRLCTPEMPEGRYVATEVLEPKDLFRLEAGEVAPADGTIVSGSGVVDESHLTGEPVPKHKRAGEPLVSGSKLTRGRLTVRASKTGKDTVLGQMMDLIEISLGQKTPLETRTDRLLRWFVPGVVGLACLTALLVYGRGGSLAEALTRAITVMVISCPCALGVAIPLTRVAGLSVAGSHGLLVRDFDAFEQAKGLDRFVFDKTGTVTQGKWRLTDIKPLAPYSESHVVALAAGLEQGVDHLIAAELRRWAKGKNIVPAVIEKAASFENGRFAVVEGKEVRIGAASLVAKDTQKFWRNHFREAFPAGEAEIPSHVYLSIDQQPAAVFVFGDMIQPTATSALEELSGRGYRLALVSGDSMATTRYVAGRVGIKDAWGDTSPQEKLNLVKGFQHAGERVAMVGDGVNDAPALAQSDLAFAVNAGNPLGKEAADVTLMRGDLCQVIDFLTLAQGVRQKVRQNLTFTFLYNAIAIPVAMSGFLSPPIAVCAMLMSSLSVIGNTLLLIRKYAPNSDSIQTMCNVKERF